MEPTTTEARIRELESIRKQINLWRGGSALVIFATLAICLGLLYSDAKALATQGPTQQLFVDKLQAGMNDKVVPRLQETASRTLTEMQPVVQKEFLALNKRVPDVTKATLDQVQMLQTSLPQTVTKALNDTFEKSLSGKEAQIKGMYPDVTEDQVKTLFQNLNKITADKSQAVAQGIIAPHVAELDGIRKNLDHIAQTEPRTANDSDNWQLGLAVFDVIREDVKDLKLPKGEAATKLKEAADTISDAAKHVAGTANKVSDTAKEMGKKAEQEGKGQ